MKIYDLDQKKQQVTKYITENAPAVKMWQQAERRNVRMRDVEAKHQVVIDMFRQGSSREEIEIVTGYQQQTISKILSKANLIMPRRLVRDYAKTIRDMHDKGHTVNEIAEAIDFTACNVREWMQQQGLYVKKEYRKKLEKTWEEEVKDLTFAKEKPLSVPYEYKGVKYMDLFQMFAGG